MQYCEHGGSHTMYGWMKLVLQLDVTETSVNWHLLIIKVIIKQNSQVFSECSFSDVWICCFSLDYFTAN